MILTSIGYKKNKIIKIKWLMHHILFCNVAVLKIQRNILLYSGVLTPLPKSPHSLSQAVACLV